MARRRVLLLLKPFDVYPPRLSSSSPRAANPKLLHIKGPHYYVDHLAKLTTFGFVLESLPNRIFGAQDKMQACEYKVGRQIVCIFHPEVGRAESFLKQVLNYLDDRCRVHKDTINFCQSVLQRKSLDWKPLLRNHLSHPMCDADLVITVGGDGTLLQASHFLDGSIPVLGVNSDPTRLEEVDELNDEFDATRSTGYLCAATAGNFEQVLDEILEGHKHPTELARLSVNLHGQQLSTFALNDILVSHPCPASVSRFSFRIKSECQRSPRLVNCRSSGLRVSTAAGSTAAMLSAGGFPIPISSHDLQYMVREPIFPRATDVPLMHGLVKPDQSMHVAWYSQEGVVYIDGSHVFYSIQHGDIIEISSEAPILKVFLPHRLLT